MVDSMNSDDVSALPSILNQNNSGSVGTSSIFDMRGSMIQKSSSKSTTSSIGSLGDLSRTMELERRTTDRKSELSPQAREDLRMAYECLAEIHSVVLTPQLMTVWSNHRRLLRSMDMLIIFVFGTTIAKWKVLSLFLSMQIIWLRGLQLHHCKIERHPLLIIEVPLLLISTQSLAHKIQIPWDSYA